MKHMSIGSIKQLGDDVYHVSFFNCLVNEEVSKSKMFELIQKHSKGFLNTLETSSLSIDYYPNKFSKHYIIVDTVMADIEEEGTDEPIVYEETEHEYRSSHKLFFKNDSTRNIINERDYSFYDVIKCSALWKRWFSKILILISLLTILSLTLLGVFSLNLANSENKTKNYFGVNGSLSLSLSLLFSLLASFTFLITWIHLKRLIVRNESQRYLMKWRRWYKSRLWSIILAGMFSFASIAFTSWFYALITSDDYLPKESNSDLHRYNQITTILNIVISILFLFSTFGVLFRMIFRKKSFLKMLFSKEEIKQFNKWIRYKMPNIQKNKKEKFLFDSNISEIVVAKEIQTSEQLKNELSLEDLRRYKRKVIQHFENAFNAYVKILKNKK